METRGEKIEEFHKHLKYRERILEFAGPKRNVAEDEPPEYSKVFDLEKVNDLKEKVTKIAAHTTSGQYLIAYAMRDRFFSADQSQTMAAIRSVSSLYEEEEDDSQTTKRKELSEGLNDMGVFAVTFLVLKLEYFRGATPDDIKNFETLESNHAALILALTMPALYPLFEMLEVAEETKKLQKTAQDVLQNRPIDLTKTQDSTTHSKSADPKPRFQKLAEVPGEDASEAEVLQTLEVIKNTLDQNKDDAAMLLALKNNPNLKSKFLAHAKCQRMTEEYQRSRTMSVNFISPLELAIVLMCEFPKQPPSVIGIKP